MSYPTVPPSFLSIQRRTRPNSNGTQEQLSSNGTIHFHPGNKLLNENSSRFNNPRNPLFGFITCAKKKEKKKKKKKSIPLQYFSPNTIASHFRFNQPAISTIVYPLQFLRTRERIKFKRRRSSKQKFLPRTILPPATRFLLPSFQ